MQKNKIYVAMSGGVDSSVAAALLQEQGYDVTGVYFKTYKPDGDREYCRKQGTDAQKVCKHLGIPFKVYDLEQEYKQHVFDYMIKWYREGHTPNPDIMCNKHIKFGVFLKKAQRDGANLIATGHYARLARECPKTPFGHSLLLKGVDENKDQSYFLSQLSQKQLSKTLFPIGKLRKPEVRQLAKKFRLHIAEKKDSQGICFIGREMNVKKFLKKYIKEKPGDVLNTSGEKIGTHSGAVFYTVGERHSFRIDASYQTPNTPKLFVILKDTKYNTITVGTAEELKQLGSTLLSLKNVNWINTSPKKGKEYECRIRHRGELYKCKLVRGSTPYNWEIKLEEVPYAPARGQFAAIYDKDECLGGGVIV